MSDPTNDLIEIPATAASPLAAPPNTIPTISDVDPKYKGRELDIVVDLRRRIMEAFDALAEHSQSNRVSADMIQGWIAMKYGEKTSLHQLGNNLRILKIQGMLEETRVRGYRYWWRTSRKYKEEYPRKLLLPLPGAMYDRCTELAKAANLSRVKFVRNMVAIGLATLDPLRRAEDYVDFLEEWKNSKAVKDAVKNATKPTKKSSDEG